VEALGGKDVLVLTQERSKRATESRENLSGGDEGVSQTRNVGEGVLKLRVIEGRTFSSREYYIPGRKRPQRPLETQPQTYEHISSRSHGRGKTPGRRGGGDTIYSAE